MTDTALTLFPRFGALDPEQVGRLVDQLPVLIWSADRELRVTSRRGGGLALLGAPATSDEGARVGEVIEDPADAVRVIAAHKAALAGVPTPYEISFRGRVFSSRVEPLRDPDGRIIGVVGMAFDVTDRRRAEDAMGESEARLRTIIESEPDCVKVVDRDGRLLDMNPAGLAMIEAPDLATVRGRSIIDLVAPEQRAAFNDLHARVIAGESGTLEFEIIGMNGRRRWLETHAVPLRSATGSIQALLGITRDVTETRRAEQQLRASRAALRSLATREQDIRESERTRIAREIHDSLGQALTALKLQLSAAQDAASKEAPALSSRLQETAAMVDDLVKGVRRIASDLRPPILDHLGLPAAVEWLAQDFSRRTGIRCEARVLPALDNIVDELATALFRIVQEALTNVLRHAGATRVSIELGMKSGCVALEINDDGTGITEANSMGPGSLGILGMRERASALGGVVEVTPRAGGGTCVAAWFPRPSVISSRERAR